MIKPVYLLILSLIGALYFGNETKPAKDPFSSITLCHNPSDDMAQLIDAPGFLSFHPSPNAINFDGAGDMISFPTPDGENANAYFIPAENPSDQWLFVYQEWWGLNDHIKKEADKFYADLGKSVNVLALDMYDGKVTNNPQEAGQFMRNVKEERLQNIVKGALMHAGENAEIANVGWCFGGSWSLKSALLTGSQNIGSVMYYGMPVRDVETLKTLNSDVLGLFATEEYISKEIIEDFASKMQQADKKLTYKIFPAVHGFSNPSNPKYDPEASKEAYEMAITYLKNKFQG